MTLDDDANPAWNAPVTSPAASSGHASRHWLSFHIGGELFAAPLVDVSEVIREGDITPVPGAAHDVLGVRHLRGRIVPVLDGCRRLAASRTCGIESENAAARGQTTTISPADSGSIGQERSGGRWTAQADLQPILHKSDRLPGVSPPMADPAQARIIMLTHAGQLVGLRVDAVGELLCTDGVEIEPPPPGRASRRDDPVTGVLAWQGGLVAMLDVCRLCRLSGEDAHVA